MRFRVKGFLPALALALLNIALAPVMGQLRDFLKRSFPGSFIKVLAVLLAILFAAALVLALRQIRERRLPRYLLLAGALALFAIQTLLLGRGILEVDVVEKVHFVQYGLLAYLLYRAFLPVGDGSVAVKALLWTTIAGALEEWVQWTVPVRTGEIGDVLLNAYAGCCGLLFALALHPLPRLRWLPARNPAILRTAALAVLVVAGFFHSAHLGYWIDEAGIGRFRSWHTEAELLEARARRSEAWATNPPRRLETFAVEDLFLTEAGWHVHRRNMAFSEEDFFTAAKEAEILARYYEPFLDIPPLPGTGNYRLHPNEMGRIEKERPRPDPRPYVSTVLEKRIFPRPGKAAFWSFAGGFAAFLFASSLRRRAAAQEESRE